MNTWVLCLSRRNALEWTIRSRSRWNGVRWSESSSGMSRRPGYERAASGDRLSSDRSIRSRKETWAVPGISPNLGPCAGDDRVEVEVARVGPEPLGHERGAGRPDQRGAGRLAAHVETHQKAGGVGIAAARRVDHLRLEGL